jgi:hypothetical protein
MAERIPIGGVALLEVILTDLEAADVPTPTPTVTVRIFGPDATTEIAVVVMDDAGPTTQADWDLGLRRTIPCHLHSAAHRRSRGALHPV